ncbi:MAG: hypothetical protein Unbinned2716contig1004_9 [Prokaryotic dsDNA virus sp.]|nr:MAG: hypothetical protein Unbinned2716contig1004_9 [Prokaryotic dsDNA virus sp.]|tara:strand:- start:21045 stop:21704 length:660 start_codon:yes stop_codon:yes gene_type:complete
MSVKIHGKEYKMVVERVDEFHNDHKENRSINTSIIRFEDDTVIVKATVRIGDDEFTGHAYEEVGSSQINQTSALENCETSAIGRALASAGYAGTEFASADEVASAISKQDSGYKMKTPQTKYSKQSKTDFTNDAWRDDLVGYKKQEKKHLTWRTLPEADLLWIIEEGPNSWNEKAVAEHGARQSVSAAINDDVKDDVDIKTDKVSAKEMDDIFGTKNAK